MDISSIKKIYFVGIGGIGMSGLARFFLKAGKKIYGYDRDKNALTKKLEVEGMNIRYKENVSKIPKGIDLVIYTPAVPETNKELIWFRENNYTVIKRAEALGQISAQKETLAIAGTHGKTTTSSILSHILTECKTKATAIVGGIMVDYDGNFIYGKGDLLVTEADEYDKSFHYLDVDTAAIMSMDADHLDIYNTYENLLEAFATFTENIRENGRLFIKAGLLGKLSKSGLLHLHKMQVEMIDFGSKDAVLYVENVRAEKGNFVFDISYKGISYEEVQSKLPGAHNAENISVAFAMAIEQGLAPKKILKAIKSFGGIKRRFERVLENDDMVILDDYAHHPTEIEAAIKTARMLYPEKMLSVIFQPHLFSRTRDFNEGFGKALSKADEVIMMDIYPAREQPILGVSSKLILDNIEEIPKIWVSKKELIPLLEKKNMELILILGAGDIDKEIDKIKSIYIKK